MSIKLKDTIYDLINNSDKLDGKDSSSFSLSGHTHNYLPLSGGTLSGPVKTSLFGLIMANDNSYATGLEWYKTDATTTIGSIIYHNTPQRFIINPIGSSEVFNDALGKYSLIVGNNELTYNTYKIWHTGNDGSSSGLDADLLDGIHAVNFMRKMGFVTNANTSLLSGSYRFQETLTGLPSGATSYGTMLTVSGGDTYDTLWQMYGNYNNNNLYYRRGNWSGLASNDWKQIAFIDSNVASADYASNAGLLDGIESSYYFKGIYNASLNFNSFADGSNDNNFYYVHSGLSQSNRPPFNYGGLLNLGIDTMNAQIGIASQGVDGLYVRTRWWSSNGGTWRAWKQIAFTDSNVSSATKLQTARKIWGQTFDGTGDVNGTMLLNVGSSLAYYDENAKMYKEFIRPPSGVSGGANLIIGRYNADYDYALSLCGKSMVMYTGSWGSASMFIDNLGNVGIGTTSPSYKLHVNGSVRASGFIKSGSSSDYVLTGDGGHKLISDLASATNARYVIADNNAKDPGHALLQSGTGRADASPSGDTWIYYDSLGGTSTPWGIKHEQASNLISFYGSGTRRAYIDLSNGNISCSTINGYTPITSGNIGSQSVNYATSAGSAGSATYLSHHDFDFTNGVSVADWTKSTVATRQAGKWFSTNGWAWANSRNINVGGYSLDRMRYSAVSIRQGNLTSAWAQQAIMFIPTYEDSSMIYLAQMTTSGTAGTVTTKVKRYSDYDTIYNALVNGYASSAGNADMVDGYHASSLWRSDGGIWNPNANITLTPTANGQEWSFDMSRGSYTGCYWHVWENTLGSCLKVEADNGKVTATYTFNCGTLQIGGETITFIT